MVGYYAMQSILPWRVLIALSLCALPYILLRRFAPGGGDSELAVKSGVDGALYGRRIAILVIVCDRHQALDRILASIEAQREGALPDFELLVSTDCYTERIESTLRRHNASIAAVLRHDLNDRRSKALLKGKRYTGSPHRRRIATVAIHYRWALAQAFDAMRYDFVIVLEDDLEIAADFYAYFTLAARVMLLDASVYCATAMNVHGAKGRHDANDYSRVWRTDYFHGWGWMMGKHVWSTLGERMLNESLDWDTWLKNVDVRANRSCLRPEVPRVQFSHWQRHGVTRGTFYQHFKKVEANANANVSWDSVDPKSLIKSNYDKMLQSWLRTAKYKGICSKGLLKSVASDKRLTSRDRYIGIKCHYHSVFELMSVLKALGVLSIARRGVAFNEYEGVLPIAVDGLRVFMAPAAPWRGYAAALDTIG